MALPFEGKVVIVTGGNSGVGAATVAIFAAQGAQVVSFDLASQATSASDSVHYVQCDVSSSSDVSKAVDEIASKFGRIDVLINNAGVADNFDPVAQVTDAAWAKVMAVNVNGPFHMMRAVIPHMLRNMSEPAPDAPPSMDHQGKPGPPQGPPKGAIVNLCSVASTHGGAAGTAYTVSKHALLGLARNTAWMYRGQGIRCNSIMLGGAATNIMANSKVQMNYEGYALSLPFQSLMGGISMPDAPAKAIVWLASDGSGDITGAELAVDRGWTTA